MRYQGKITKWNIEKDFGFVLPNGGNKEVFLHISAFKSRNHQPQISQLITYELVKDESGRDRACNASSVASKNLKSSSSDKAEISFLFILFIGLSSTFILERIFVGALPFEYLFVYLIANLAAFLYYYIDKTAALNGDWRKSEDSLHLLSLLGGWPGAYIVQKMFRHKNKKASFQLVYKATVIIHCSVITLYSVPQLQELIRSLLIAK